MESKRIAFQNRRRCINPCAMQPGNDGAKSISATPASAATAANNDARTSSGGRCLKPGPVLRNPYLNFLREFRKNNCGLSAVETVKRGAQEWKKLSQEQKLKYIAEAFYAPRRRRLRLQKMSRSKARKRSVTRSRRRRTAGRRQSSRKC